VSLWCIFVTQHQVVNHINIFFSATLRALLLPVSLLTVLVSVNSFSSLLMLLSVHHVFGNSLIKSVALYPFNQYIFFINILSSLLKTMFTNTAVTSAMM